MTHEEKSEPPNKVEYENWRQFYVPAKIPNDQTKEYLYFSECTKGCKLTFDIDLIDDYSNLFEITYSYEVKFLKISISFLVSKIKYFFIYSCGE